MKKAHSIRLLVVAFMSLMSITPALAAVPSNDDFDNAQAIVALPFTTSLNTAEATVAPDDPDCRGSSTSVWYTFTPASDIAIEANTFGSSYDTTLSVYTGSRGGLTQMACNDDTQGYQSRVRLDLSGGVTYYFMVGAFYDGPGGNLVLSVMPFSLPDPITLELQADRIASVDRRSGVATLHGTITCSRPTEVAFGGHLLQKAARNNLIRGIVYGGTSCSGATPFSVTAISEYELTHLATGPAKLTLFAYTYDYERDEFVETQVEASVVLTGGHK